MNARGDDEVEHLQDVEVRIREVALHGVCKGVAHALAAARSRSKVDLLRTLSPNLVEECNHDDHDELAEDFTPLGAAVADALLARDIVLKVFLGP